MWLRFLKIKNLRLTLKLLVKLKRNLNYFIAPRVAFVCCILSVAVS